VIVSLLLAVLLNSKFLKAENTYTTIFYMPVVTSILVVAVIWGRVIFELNTGLLNVIFGFIGPFLDLIYAILNILTLGLVPALKAAPRVDWLTNYLMESIAAMSIWRRVGFNVLILLAGLKSIPKNLYEAAEIDGHGSLSQFRNITLPMLSGPLGVVMILELINGWQIFQELYGLNQAGSDNTLAVYLIAHYARADVMTFASAVGYFIFAMTAFLGLLDRIEARTILKLIPLFTLFAVLFNIPSNRADTLPTSLGFNAAWTYDQLFLLLALIALLYYLLIVVLNLRFNLIHNLLALLSYPASLLSFLRFERLKIKQREFRRPKLKPTIIYTDLRRDLSSLRTIGFFMLFTTLFYFLNGYDTITKQGFGSTIFIGTISSMNLFYLFFIVAILMVFAYKYVPFLYKIFSSKESTQEVVI
jgi:ABC-type sugar transport system permease subunit